MSAACSAHRSRARPSPSCLVLSCLVLRCLVIWCLGPMWAESVAIGQAMDDAKTPEVTVSFYSPPADQPVAGDVEVWFDVTSNLEVTQVILRVDNREMARFTEAPYQAVVPVGEGNARHRFEVLVRSHDVEIARAVRETPDLHVDETLELELRQLYVTVEEREQRIRDLELDDFEVTDDRQPQRLVTFEDGDAPLAAMILVDASVSMRGAPLESAVAGATAFIDGLLPLDEASVTLFSDRTLAHSEFLTAGADPQKSLSSLQADGGTALNDHLYFAVKTLEGRQGRRVVILLSDGIDIHSVLDIDQVRWSVQRSQSIVYWIELTKGRSPSDGIVSPWRDRQQHEHEMQALRQLVLESGGRILPIGNPDQAPAVFAEILEELRSQYVLGYYPTSDLDDGKWHEVRVRVVDPKGRKLMLRTREGYWDLP